jgi:hypothetical protein
MRLNYVLLLFSEQRIDIGRQMFTQRLLIGFFGFVFACSTVTKSV